MKDDLAPESILAEIGDKAKNAFQAALDFFEWRADNEPLFRAVYGSISGVSDLRRLLASSSTADALGSSP